MPQLLSIVIEFEMCSSYVAVDHFNITLHLVFTVKQQSVHDLLLCLSECQQAHNLYRYVQSLQLSSCDWEDDTEGDCYFVYHTQPVLSILII